MFPEEESWGFFVIFPSGIQRGRGFPRARASVYASPGVTGFLEKTRSGKRRAEERLQGPVGERAEALPDVLRAILVEDVGRAMEIGRAHV